MGRSPDNIIGSTSRNTIFHVLNRSSRCFDRPVSRMLEGFRMSLPIISWVTRATLGYKTIFPWNVCSQPLILRAFGKSPRELLVEYQTDVFFLNRSKCRKYGARI
jgi:hypothetical protein